MTKTTTQQEKTTIYQKLSEVRNRISDIKIPKSGYNKYAGFKYYELEDFLPVIQKLENDYYLCSIFDMSGAFATLTIIDSQDPVQRIIFRIPKAEVRLGKKDGSGGAQPIQNLGAQITYLKRYLYMNAYGISDKDVVDAGYFNLNDALYEIEKAKTLEELRELYKKYKLDKKITTLINKKVKEISKGGEK